MGGTAWVAGGCRGSGGGDRVRGRERVYEVGIVGGYGERVEGGARVCVEGRRLRDECG